MRPLCVSPQGAARLGRMREYIYIGVYFFNGRCAHSLVLAVSHKEACSLLFSFCSHFILFAPAEGHEQQVYISIYIGSG